MQPFSLSVLAVTADLGMSLVFLHRFADESDDADRPSAVRSAMAFYQKGTVILTATLLIVCLLPDSVLGSHRPHTTKPWP